METNLLHILQSLAAKPSPCTTIFFASRTQNNPRFLNIVPVRNSSRGNNSISNEDVPPPPETVEIRFRKRSRKRRQFKEDDDDDDVMYKAQDVKEAPKKWEEMSLSEKAIELYMGEKGVLFWLNKFAYASIFIIIGGWILFRFVGPSLNLYQLDTPPLSPSNILKG